MRLMQLQHLRSAPSGATLSVTSCIAPDADETEATRPKCNHRSFSASITARRATNLA